MKHFSFLLSMLVVTAAVAQKPLDRGIHKRTTGGVSFLFGEKKAQDVDKTDVVAFDVVVALETVAPSLLSHGVAPAALVEMPDMAAFAVAEPMNIEDVILTDRVLRKLNRKGLSMVAGPVSEKRLFRRANPLIANPADSDAPMDWASIVGFVTGILFWAVPGFWLLGIIFGAIGMKRTKDGSLRGRKLAVAGFVCGLVAPVVLFLLIGLLLAAA
ncbi:MAG: DUF4190 domain-containing protein [Bacteroidota bacterium]|nr:DUF4190 domain-containing protein [Bacteroidota bacterium]